MKIHTIRGVVCALLAAGLTVLAAPAPVVREAEMIAQLKGHKNGMPWAVAFSPDGKTVATAGHDRCVKIWDAESSKCLHTLFGHEFAAKQGKDGIARALAFSKDGKILATGSDNEIRLWDAKTGKSKGILSGEVRAVGPVRSLAFSPDGKTLLSGASGVRLWDVAKLKELWAADIPDGNQPSVGFDSQGKALALGRGKSSEDNRYETVYLHEAQTGKILFTLKGHDGEVGCMSFSPDGKSVVTTGRDGTIRSWSLATGNQLASISLPRARIGSLAITPDSKAMAVGYKHSEANGSDSQPEAASVKVFDIKSSRELLTLTGKNNPIGPLAFSPDGTTLAVGLLRQPMVQIWKLPSTKEKK
jgi:WD40 repeat protein